MWFLLLWAHLLEVGSCCQSRQMNCEKFPPVVLNPIGHILNPLIAKHFVWLKTGVNQTVSWEETFQMWRNVLPESATGHFQGARTGPPSVWGLEEQPPSRLLLGNQEEKILKIHVSKHVLVLPQLWTVTTRAFAIYLSTRRSTRWPHVPTVWLLMSDAQRIFQTEVDLRTR